MRYSQSCGAAISIRLLDAYLRFPYDWCLARNTADIVNNVLNETNRVVASVLEPAAAVPWATSCWRSWASC